MKTLGVELDDSNQLGTLMRENTQTATMENLSSDIIQEIFTRLPIKSVLQCRKVCRFWRYLLGKPKTGMLFADFPKYYSLVDLYYGEPPWEIVNFNPNEASEYFNKIVTQLSNVDTKFYSFRLIGSCNGLVCYKACDPNFGHVMYIFNPITGERIRVQDMSVDEYFQCVGFGYCHSTDEYKVVRIRYLENGKDCIQVYTLGDGNGWRDIKEIDYTSYMFQGFGVFANGALHWLDERSNFDIVAFNLTDGILRSLPSPPCHIPVGSYYNINLGSLGGNLYLCLRYIKRGEHMTDIWVFKKRNMNNCRRGTRINERTCFNSFTWIKVFSRKWESSLTQKCQLLSLSKSEILLWKNGSLMSCDPKDKTSKIIWYVEGPRPEVQLIPHMNSLVSLKDLGEELVDC
ncbi:F-box/kelch-repeat protein At3g23880-like [Papaver somniferum]|uniref:F-box/kelch-repeat protein At3g23880-like n=1 Tax=Papaver somniferum TaxID=3469 RepID=UPI000E6F7088|nr:F-box/kelch-repeat protein At3g23880-like [Papaver somniferum]